MNYFFRVWQYNGSSVVCNVENVNIRKTYLTKKCSDVIASYFGSSLTFRPEDGSEFAAVNLEGDIFEDNSDPDASNQLLEAGPGLYLNKYNFYILYFVFTTFLSVQ